MNFIFKQFTTRYVNLNSELDAVTLEAQMREFCGRSFWSFSDNLSGRVRNDGRYSFSRKWQIGPSGGGMMPRLKAKIITQGNGSLIEVSIPAPFGSAFIAIIFIVVGFIILCTSFSDVNFNASSFIGGVTFMVVPPAVIAFQNSWSRGKLLDTFIDVFNLREI